jgi:chromosome segregation ATPase
MDNELAALEERVDALIAQARALHQANEALRQQLLAAQDRNRDLALRMSQASSRLDTLISRMPVE